ncbi:hypothetical protein Psal006b_00936 [Piscirickettsia salmonis]|uniref:Ankyrin repeat family protein n=1 Tax=Piscirickettsia salmonis TaxID=1238 RepID=A0AAC8ZPJ1_PISSA|nr:hypothetical protein [Piscirickettsia salmonis]ALB23447.1 ankyrin repeat family protein [Piscirickettsia salmonis]QGN97953.1 hypothetical protein Psal006b_00936 [Piscirickettsia salmonis]QGO01564.1 hypothetical protein Psal008_00945 [Piscirickettsia salmonis]QGO12266.1 hypothetical protein Psal010b_00937 [Piscirickettsia salmonis]QGO19299.1 hypothetical protein Psal013_00942 [Piscirickettsia salmonis]
MPDTFKRKKDQQLTSSRALFELLASPGPQDLERVSELLELGANPNESGLTH